ncbi:hypothetical protein T472_0206415 [Youngiibacter fragilis 232.1]|uniref:DNA/RNA non-specific endonuclease/pyrophosphatase/phosphodiesterase domain-containing protein n=2 Tax=Youngiibacter TaxID=1408818 RepID=V7I858_9CLOT|nr:hypothetical protein T472_0206415 [Youngiibacter fragilis 232.1]
MLIARTIGSSRFVYNHILELWNKEHEDTFHCINCSPQHKNLNQKTWLNHEVCILSNAAKHSMKVDVFIGPVFCSDTLNDVYLLHIYCI